MDSGRCEHTAREDDRRFVVTGHVGLAAARMHAVLVTRPGSDVFHVYAGPLTPSGRFVPRAARTVCTARTRRLSVLERVGAVLDLAGRRVCGRCSARLSAFARRAEQPPVNRDLEAAYWQGVGLGDLVVALALTTTTAEAYTVSRVARMVADAQPGVPGVREAYRALDQKINRRLDRLRAAELSPEEREAAAARREAEADDAARAIAARQKAAAMDRAVDRRNAGLYLTPWERALLPSSA